MDLHQSLKKTHDHVKVVDVDEAFSLLKIARTIQKI